MITRGVRLSAVIASLALFAACGGGDDDDADGGEVPEAAAADDGDDAEPADTATPVTTVADEEPAATTAVAVDEEDDDDDDDDGDKIEVDDIGDLPEECRDTFADFLRTIEPVVEGIDWENASMADFDSVTAALDTEMSGMEDEMDAACGDFDVTESDEGIQMMIDFARDEAPGTVGYLEFLAGFMEDFSGFDGSEAAADLPADCAGLISYIEDLMGQHSGMSALPMADVMTVSTALTQISTTCTMEESSAFFERDDVNEFMSS